MKRISIKSMLAFTALLLMVILIGKQQTAIATPHTSMYRLLEEANASTIPAPEHVVILIMENHAYSEIIGAHDAPYINSLATDPSAVLFTNSHAIEHPSEPNYLDLFSGSNQGVTNDGFPQDAPFITDNLGRQLLNKGKTFCSYMEGLPNVGFDGMQSGEYVRKHNPSVSWIGKGANQIPAATNQPFNAFPSNFANLPTVSFVVPDLNNDMHDGTVRMGDNWIKKNMDAYVQWAKANNSLLIITFDEDDTYHGNLIPTIFIGSMVKGGKDASPINHYSVLRTIEDMYKLPYAGAAANARPITDCWK
jgi:phospholipase C